MKVQQVAADLGIDYVLEGSVRTAGDKVRVTAQLIDAQSGDHVWADRFDREGNIVVLQEDVANAALRFASGSDGRDSQG